MPNQAYSGAAPRRLHLVDASPYIFRAFFSLPSSLTDPEGRPINAVRGFVDMLARFIREERPEALLVAFDGSLTTSFRNDVYPEYKANRELPDEGLVAQLDRCQEVAAALGAFCCIDDRYEADDLVATAKARFAVDVEETVVDGVTKKEERKVYCSPSSVRALIRKIEHPLRMVKDLEERELLCKSFYNEMVSELNNIDRRTVTTVLFHLSKNSMALSDAQNSVQRTYTEQGKPSQKRERGASSSGGSSSARASSSSYSAL